MADFVKAPAQIERIRKSGMILAETLKALEKAVAPGVTTIELDRLAREMIEKAGGEPAFLGYRPTGAEHPFPYTLCTSVDDIIVHGRPSDMPLKEGQIVSLDLGVNWQGGISDAAVTVPVGKISPREKILVDITRRALNKGVEAVRPGRTTGDIGHAIERAVLTGGGYVADGLTGHGVGTHVHEDPVIYNFGEPNTGVELKEGMVIAIEPMVSLETAETVQLPDDSFKTGDGSRSAHLEHTVLVTKDGHEVLTK